MIFFKLCSMCRVCVWINELHLCCLQDKLMFAIISSQLSLQLQQFGYFFINLQHTYIHREDNKCVNIVHTMLTWSWEHGALVITWIWKLNYENLKIHVHSTQTYLSHSDPRQRAQRWDTCCGAKAHQNRAGTNTECGQHFNPQHRAYKNMLKKARNWRIKNSGEHHGNAISQF